MKDHLRLVLLVSVGTLLLVGGGASCRCSPKSDIYRPGWIIEKGKKSISESVKTTVLPFSRKVRVAVLNFRDRDGGEELMAAVTDEVIRQLGSFPELILLERSRLKEILDEQALGKSGILRPEDLSKIGRLVQADVVVSGFYTATDRTRVRVDGRFTGIVTGEVLGTFSFWMRLGEGKRPKPVPGEVEARCEAVARPVMEALGDLRTPDRIEALVQVAIRIPFDENCGLIHLRIIATLERHQLFPQRYRDFLAATLRSLEDPDARYDRRPIPILRFFSADGLVDPVEWESALTFLEGARAWIPREQRRMAGGWVYYRFLFSGWREEQSVRRARIDELMQKARERKLGRPTVATEAAILERLIRGLGSVRREARHIAFSDQLYAFRKYSSALRGDRRATSRILGSLTRAYLHAEAEPADRRQMRDALVEFIAAEPKTEWLAQIAWKWMNEVEAHLTGRLVMAKPGQADLREDLKRINHGLREWICTSIERERGERLKAAHVAYAGRHGVFCPGMRTPEQLASVLTDRNADWPSKEAALQNLIGMGAHAKPAEPAARVFLGPVGHAPQARVARRLAARLLGLIAPEGESQRLLVGALGSNDPARSEATRALVALHATAMPAIIEGLRRSPDAGVRAQCAWLLGKLGRDGQKALPALGVAERTDSSRLVRDFARRAREQIENDF